MSRRGSHQSKCSIATALSILGDKWTLLIARDILLGSQNFESIQNNLNISRNLLTERLKSMVNEKLITRYVPDDKKRAKYVPTERCKDLLKVFLSLSLWADRWVPDTRRPKMEGVINDKVTEISLQVIPYNKAEENKNIKLSKILAN
ncbi:helix-turn-helix transcriptional regulator [Paracoccaceae bacterium]|nr:helix-turn-helix transcriptional regulator [Paracoccaceae bacterium]